MAIFRQDTWFIGMEEGGGDSFDDISRRLSVWESRGEHELEDVRDYIFAIGIEKYFREPVTLQRTWGHLIRVFLSMNSQPTNSQNLKDFQKDQFAREAGDICIMELMPLPSPGLVKWLYSQWSNLDYLRTRESYLRHVLPDRIKLIHSKIETFKPPFVIFYGFSYKEYYEKIAGSRFHFDKENECYRYQNKDTFFLIMKHPVARNVNDQYFIKIGKL